MPRENISQDALTQADQAQNEFSDYQGALGQSGVQDVAAKMAGGGFLSRAGDKIAVSPPADGSGFSDIYIGCAWNTQTTPKAGFFGRLLGLSTTRKFDLDLGVMYELADGTRGALQALGTGNGAHDTPPYIVLSHDERSGLSDDDDEYICVNGQKWAHIKRLLVYTYIYAGAVDWAQVAPAVQVKVAGQAPLQVTPRMARENLPVCAIALIENVRGGFTLENLTEYFPGQIEMDRAYGFGVAWEDGLKDNV